MNLTKTSNDKTNLDKREEIKKNSRNCTFLILLIVYLYCCKLEYFNINISFEY